MGNYIGKEPTTNVMTREYFAGTGSQTAYTLTYPPGGVNGVIVSISGVVQQANSYSVAGNTLTFTQAPPAPSSGVTYNIEIIYLTVGGASTQANWKVPYTTVTNTGDALTGVYNPTITALVDDLRLGGTVSATNTTTTPTFSPDGVTAKTICKRDNQPLLVGDLPKEMDLIFNSGYDKWVLLNPASDLSLDKRMTLKRAIADIFTIEYDRAHRDVTADGWYPSYFNQQWGGAPHYFELSDTITGQVSKFEAATGYIDTGTLGTAFPSVAAAAGNTWIAQGFKVSQNITCPAIWLKIQQISSTTDPNNNLEMRILPDDGTGTKPTGSTAITNGTATAIPHKAFPNSSSPMWVKFTFPTPPTLTANTQYHLTIKSSGAVSATYYWQVEAFNTGKVYPYGNMSSGDGTPTWTASTTSALTFLVEQSASTETYQSGGLFSKGKMQFFEGTPLFQSNSRCKDLNKFRDLDVTDCTLLVRGTAWTKDRTIMDIGYGLDHDRIVLRSNVTTGYAQVDVYNSAGTKFTVTGTTDISSGNSDIAIRLRAKGDGADVLQLWVNGVSQGTPLSSQTISFDKAFSVQKVGTAWIGGGFNLAPTWSGVSLSSITSLPSSSGWTFTTSGVAEADIFSIATNGGLKQSAAISSQAGYYLKTTAGFSNTNGWGAYTKKRVIYNISGAGSPADGSCLLQVADGTKVTELATQSVTLWTINNNVNRPVIYDTRASDFTALLCGKGSDMFYCINHKFTLDGTGMMTSASGSNQIAFGDLNNSASLETEAYWRSVKYYNTSNILPQATSGSLSELCFIKGDQTSLLATLWNSGTPISIKDYCGLERNYLSKITEVQTRTYHPYGGIATTSTTPVALTDMLIFGIGNYIDIAYNSSGGSNTAGNAYITGIYINNVNSTGGHVVHTEANGRQGTATFNKTLTPGPSQPWETQGFFGLHSVRAYIWVDANTGTIYNRNMTTKATVVEE